MIKRRFVRKKRSLGFGRRKKSRGRKRRLPKYGSSRGGIRL